METLKARGHRATWFARIGDEEVPCAWDWWRTGNHYLDPGARPGKGKWDKFIAAIKTGGKVALTGKREVEGKWQRDGYIALYRVANVRVSDQRLEFDFVEPPIAKLK
jgi:hypothetical protein